MTRDMDQIRMEMRKLISIRNNAVEGCEEWFDIQDHLNTLLWVVGAVDEKPSDRMLANRHKK